jgi:2-amino-4-hydroxy-6-hydroxymethyldihydropteridine diphosphokinase
VGIAYLGLGTNIGDRSANLQRALQEMSRAARIFAVSRVYESAPVGYAEQDVFWNLVARVSTSLAPAELLVRLKAIESSMGRVATFRNGPRLIDIDILFYDDLVVDDDGVAIPHPRALERAFVLRPLLEVGAELVDPRSARPVASFLPGVEGQVAFPVETSEMSRAEARGRAGEPSWRGAEAR